jgi:molybdate transport system substrate-binding protein
MRSLVALSFLLPSVTVADDAIVAVAANFQPVLERLADRFEDEYEHRLTITSGSTGKLYAQIRNGAPFDVLLSADQRRPSLLAEEALGDGTSQFTYAIGRLAIVGADESRLLADPLSTLAQDGLRIVAIANPALAPYGLAAREVLDAHVSAGTSAPRVVMGENVGQAFALVATGNADLGIVALSLPILAGHESYLAIPADWHVPIRQDAILLAHGRSNPAATAFMQFLRQDEDGRQMIVAAGFSVE